MAQIIRALLELQAEEGWLPPARLEELASRLRVPLHRLESVSTFYTHFRREPAARPVVSVCRDLSCHLAGAAAARSALAASEAGAEVREVSCLGRCDHAPAAEVAGEIVRASDSDAIRDLLQGDGLLGSNAQSARQDSGAEPQVRAWPAADPYCEAGRPAYHVLRAALAAPRGDLSAQLEEAGLRGMGGAGFPTGRKWSLVAAEGSDSKHVICNADESEPGTFKDRQILFDLPHLVIEGILLGAYCVGAERGTVFIRHEYEPERKRLEAAIAAAREAGALGREIFGSDFSFELDVFVSPGGYILGEETALLECMEDRRGEPRNKPPFPGQSGLFGRPTLINNVETLVHAVGITHWGVDWWKAQGRDGFVGQKFISTSGDVARPGVELFPVGTKLAEVLEAHGGMKQGASLLAVAPGGASSNFLGSEALELALDFDALAKAGTMLGSGAVVFVSTEHDLLETGLSITRFFRNESCGKCVPCRVGSEKAVALVEKSGCVSEDDEALLRSLDATMKQTSICGLGQVALGPLLSILDRFPSEVPRTPSAARRTLREGGSQ